MNPMTGKIEKNLDQAKVTIDTIVMLKNKTEGNLSEDEKNVLNSIVQQLQLNYVDEVSKKNDDPQPQVKENEKEKKEDQPEKETKIESEKKEDMPETKVAPEGKEDDKEESIKESKKKVSKPKKKETNEDSKAD